MRPLNLGSHKSDQKSGVAPTIIARYTPMREVPQSHYLYAQSNPARNPMVLPGHPPSMPPLSTGFTVRPQDGLFDHPSHPNANIAVRKRLVHHRDPEPVGYAIYRVDEPTPVKMMKPTPEVDLTDEDCETPVQPKPASSSSSSSFQPSMPPDPPMDNSSQFEYADDSDIPMTSKDLQRKLLRSLQVFSTVHREKLEDGLVGDFARSISAAGIAHRHMNAVAVCANKDDTLSEADENQFRVIFRGITNDKANANRLKKNEQDLVLEIMRPYERQIKDCTTVLKVYNCVAHVLNSELQKNSPATCDPTEIQDNGADAKDCPTINAQFLERLITHCLHEVLYIVCKKHFGSKFEPFFSNQTLATDRSGNAKSSVSGSSSDPVDHSMFHIYCVPLNRLTYFQKIREKDFRPSEESTFRFICSACHSMVFSGMFDCMSGHVVHCDCLSRFIEANREKLIGVSWIFFEARNPAII